MGFIIQSTNPDIEIGNDSRLLNNDMIILGDVDYNLFIEGELVGGGFINPLGIYTSFGNDSKLYPSGIVVLGSIDYNLLMTNQITYEELLGGNTI